VLPAGECPRGDAALGGELAVGQALALAVCQEPLHLSSALVGGHPAHTGSGPKLSRWASRDGYHEGILREQPAPDVGHVPPDGARGQPSCLWLQDPGDPLGGLELPVLPCSK
jgi:hypothetical protein